MVRLIEVGTQYLQSPETTIVLPPPERFQAERPISWERKPGFENYPAGATLTVGSFGGRDIEMPTRQYFVGYAEGGIVGAGQFPAIPSARRADVKTGEGWQSLVQHCDEMNYQSVCGDPEQHIEGLPTLISVKGIGVRVEAATIEREGKIGWDTEHFPTAISEWDAFMSCLESDFTMVLGGSNVDLKNYRFPDDAAPGFYALLRDLPAINEYHPWAIKLQLASPANILKNITDRTGKKLEESGDFTFAINMMVALRNRWMVEEVRKHWDGRIILSTDNPSADLMSSEDLAQDAEFAFSLVKGMGNVLTMEHSCGGRIDDMSFANTAGLHGLHLDAFGEPLQIKFNAEGLAEFLAAGEDRFLALGIVPTNHFKNLAEELRYGEPIESGKIYKVAGLERSGTELAITSDADAVAVVTEHYAEALERLYARLAGLVKEIYVSLSGKFATEQDVWKKIMVSSSCGQGRLDVGVGKMVFALMRDLSYLVRQRQEFADYGSE